MGIVTDINRLVVAAWSPSGTGGGCIAGGSFAGAIDSSFESVATLEVFGLDSANSKLAPIAATRSTERFDSISWSRPSRTHPKGLIAGGLHDGTVRVWDAAALLREPQISSNVDKAVVFGRSTSPKKHNGPVPGLEFNPFRPTLLASCGLDGQVLIWDLSNVANGAIALSPSGSTQQSAGAAARKEGLLTLAWNRHVAHILATGSTSGEVAIWNLKLKRPILSIPNPRGALRCSSISWNPEVAMQILTCSDEKEEKGGLLWDLRNTIQPLIEFTHHGANGILASSWCPYDSEMILTSSKDSRTVVVSATSGSVVAELAGSNQWSYDVQWSPRLPGVYLTTSFDGRLAVRSLLTADSKPSVSVETANVLAESFGAEIGDFKSGMMAKWPRATSAEGQKISVSQPPKWLRRPCCISFGFGGRAVTLKSSQSGTVEVHKPVKVTPDFKAGDSDLDVLLSSAVSEDPSPIKKYCTEAAKSSTNAEDATAWTVLAIQLEKNARVRLLAHLGYEVSAAENSELFGIELSPPLAQSVRQSFHEGDQSTPDNGTEGGAVHDVASARRELDALQLDGAAPWDVSEGLLDSGTNSEERGKSQLGNGLKGILAEKEDATTVNGINLRNADAASVENLVKKSVIVGEFETAVKTCLQAGRTADALILAHVAGPEIWHRTQREYLSSISSSSSMGIIRALSESKETFDEFVESVASSEAKNAWKDALAVLVTYEYGPAFSQKCNSLGHRLMEKQNHAAALTCFTCSMNTKMMILTWMRKRPTANTPSAAYSQRLEMLAELVKKIRICSFVASIAKGGENTGGYQVHDETSAKVFLEYAALLAARGELELAQKYVNNIDGSVTSIYGSAEDMKTRIEECINLGPVDAGVTYQSSSYESSGTNRAFGSYFGETQAPGSPFDGSRRWAQQQMQAAKPESSLYQAPAPLPASPYVPPPVQAVPSYKPPLPSQPAYSTGLSPSQQYTPPSQYSVSYSSQTTAAALPAVPEPLPGAIPPPPAPIVPSPTSASGPYGTSGQLIHGPSPLQPAPYLQPTAPIPPPPPPQSSQNVPSPQPISGKVGASARLPPSAEVAVAEARSRHPVSSSGMPGRRHSRSSSASSTASLGKELVVTIDKADTSKIPADKQVIVRSLRGAFMFTVKLNNSPLYKRKMDDISKKLGRLLYLINAGSVDHVVLDLLAEIAKFIERGDYESASKVVVQLTKEHWDGNGFWIQSLKRLFDSARSRR